MGNVKFNWFILVAPVIAMLISALDQAIEFSEEKLEEASDVLLKKLGEVGNIFVDPDPNDLRQLREKWNAEKEEVVERMHTIAVYLIERHLKNFGFAKRLILHNLPLFEEKLIEVEFES